MSEKLFVVHHSPTNPQGSWSSGVEVDAVFYPALFFPSRSQAMNNARAMNAVVRKVPEIAERLRRQLRRDPAALCRKLRRTPREVLNPKLEITPV